MYSPNQRSVEIPHHMPQPADRRARVIAGLLTAMLYAGFAVLLWQHAFWTMQPSPPTGESFAIVLPDAPDKNVSKISPHLLTHLIRPHVQTVAPPVFTIASSAPLAQSLLPASVENSSPMPGGSDGTGAMGQAASANGSSGNGTGGACLDPIWMHAVTERVRHFVYYPAPALSSHTTGVVLVHFVVRRSGRLSTLEISKSSGDWALDSAAYNIMRAAQPLPAIPDRMHTDRVDGVLPMDFGALGLDMEPTIGHCGD
jgi:TonB family protein